jgi:hypothetical protein
VNQGPPISSSSSAAAPATTTIAPPSGAGYNADPPSNTVNGIANVGQGTVIPLGAPSDPQATSASPPAPPASDSSNDTSDSNDGGNPFESDGQLGGAAGK